MANAVRFMGHLDAEMAHEIRNILGAIRGAAEILQDDFPQDHPKAEFLAILLGEMHRLHGLVAGYLSHIRGLALVPLSVAVNLNLLLATVSGPLRCQAAEKRVQLHSEVPTP